MHSSSPCAYGGFLRQPKLLERIIDFYARQDPKIKTLKKELFDLPADQSSNMRAPSGIANCAPATSKPTTDEELTQDHRIAPRSEPEKDGWITLRGEVDYYFERTAAERAVRNLAGVKGVSNVITVRPRVSPRDIKSKIETTFKRQAEFDAKNISVETSNGEVILRGEVRSWAERRAAENAAWSGPGVTSVKNYIRVRAA